MSRVLGLVFVVCGVVAACGGGADDTADSPSSTPTSPSPSQQASQSPSSTVVDAGTDLSDFVCEADKDGEWNASGVITNSSGSSSDYRVTVVVAEGPGVSVPGKRRVLTQLAPRTPEPFEVKAIPATGESDSTCQVEVLRLP